jgi:P27 family predicted phage terminase small subunit
MRGRPPKPTHLKILEGNRGHRQLDPNAEPQPAKGIMEPPAGLPPEALGVWETIVPELDRLGLVTMVDEAAIEAACRGVATARSADLAIDRIMAEINRKVAECGTAPQADLYNLAMLNAVSKKGWQQYKSFATEFGLTPASRTKLVVPGGKSGVSRQLDAVEKACG